MKQEGVQVTTLIVALKKGNSLNNLIFWKNIQSICNLIASIVPVLIIVLPWLPIWFTAEFFIKLSAALGAVSLYLTNATSEKVGI